MGIFKKLFGKSKSDSSSSSISKMENNKNIAEKQEKKNIAPADKDIKIDSDKTVKISSSLRLSVPEERIVEAKKPQVKKGQTKAAPSTEVTRTENTQGSSTSVGNTAAKGGYFDIKKSKNSKYVFNLYASNHVIIATSQIYSSVSAAQNGIQSVKENAPIAPTEDQTKKDHETLSYPKWEIYEDGGGQFRFRLSASNGSCICHSQGYTKKTSCKNGIESIRRFAPAAEIKKSYLKKDT